MVTFSFLAIIKVNSEGYMHICIFIQVTCLYDGGRFPVMPVNKDATISMLSGLHEYESYHIYVQIKTKNGYGEKSKAFTVQLG